MFDSYDLPCGTCSNEPNDRISLVRVIELLDRDYQKNDIISAERHLEYWKKEAAMLGDYRSELSLCNEQIGLCRRTGNKEKAFEAITRADELIRKLGLSRTESAATIFLNMATTYLHFGEKETSMTFYQKAETGYRYAISENSYEYAALYNNKATALESLNRFEEAEILLQKALLILENCPDHKADQAISYVNLARLVSVWKRDIDQSQVYLSKAWEVLTDPEIKRDGLYAFVCIKASEVFAAFGKKDEVEALLEVAKEIYEGN